MHGKGAHKYDNVHIGINGRLDTIQAAILLEKLPDIRGRDHPAQPGCAKDTANCWKHWSSPRRYVPESNSVWAQYTIQSGERDAIAQELKRQGIPSAVYYPAPLHRQPAYNRLSPRA